MLMLMMILLVTMHLSLKEMVKSKEVEEEKDKLN
jgi:hypothetical protein